MALWRTLNRVCSTNIHLRPGAVRGIGEADLFHCVPRIESFALPIHEKGRNGLARPSKRVVAPKEIALRPMVRQIYPMGPTQPERQQERESHKDGNQRALATRKRRSSGNAAASQKHEAEKTLHISNHVCAGKSYRPCNELHRVRTVIVVGEQVDEAAGVLG